MKDESKNIITDTEDCSKLIPSACAVGWVAPLPDPIYNEDGITLYCADCTRVLPLLKENIGLLLADPPYGINVDCRNDTQGRGIDREIKGQWKNKRWSARDWKNVYGDDKPFLPSHLLGYENIVLWGANNYSSRLPDSHCWFVWDRKDERAADSNITDCRTIIDRLRQRELF